MMQEQKITTYHWVLFAICFLGTAFTGTASTLMSVYLPVAVKDLLGNKNESELNNISAYINAIFILGGAFGGFISGIITDKAGRKKGVILSIACYGLFTVLTGYMPHWEGVVICRFFTGFGLGAVLVTTTTIMVEEWPEKSRAIFIGILSISMPVGIFSAGVIDYFVSSWRQGFLVGFFPLLIAVLSIWLLRESSQWKFNRDPVVQRVKQDGNIFAPAHRTELIIGSVIFGTMLIGLWAIFSWIPTWIQSLITTADAQKERGISMMMLGMGGLTGGFLSGWVVNAIGLRRSMLMCFLVSAVLSFVLLKTNNSFSPVIYVEIAVLALFFGVSQGVLSVYIPGLFPVNIRGRATGFCFNIGRIFTATAVLFVGVLVTELGGYGNSLFIFSLVFVVGLLVVFFYEENSGQIIRHQLNSYNMAHIKVEEGVPGIRSLVLFRPETGKHLYALTQVLLRDESPLSQADRELIAAHVSQRNNCMFCMSSHAAAARCLYGDQSAIVDEVLKDMQHASVSDKLKALLNVAGKVQISGKAVLPADIDAAKLQGATDREIHDTVLIAAAFCMYNRYVDGLASLTSTNPDDYVEMGKRMATNGYVMPPQTNAIPV